MATTEQNAAAMRRMIEETARGNLAVVDECFAPDVAVHGGPQGLPDGRESVRSAIEAFTAAFADANAEIDVLVSEGDKVVARVTVSGTHRGPYLGVEATGRHVAWSGTDIARFEDGRIVEVWRSADVLGLLQQLTGPSRADDLKARFQRYIDEIWNEGALDVADEMFSPDYIAHMPADPERERGRGPEVIKEYVRVFRAAFPDLTVELHALVVDGDEVAARGVVSGTFQGPLFGIPPTGARATWTLTGFDRFDENGLITDGWGDMDMLGALQKLGVIPAPGDVPTSAREELAA
jgi:predicted ester cyclase